MTIEEHISRIKARGFKYKEDKEIAIRSLEAWEKVKTEIVERTKHLDEHDKEDMRELAGILSILASITEHLQGVTTDADSD